MDSQRPTLSYETPDPSKRPPSVASIIGNLLGALFLMALGAALIWGLGSALFSDPHRIKLWGYFVLAPAAVVYVVLGVMTFRYCIRQLLARHAMWSETHRQ